MDWRRLVDRYGDRVLLLSRSILREESLSRDAAQETLPKLGRANGEVRNWNAFVPTVAGNPARRFLSRRRARPAAKADGLESKAAAKVIRRLALVRTGIPLKNYSAALPARCASKGQWFLTLACAAGWYLDLRKSLFLGF